METNPSRELYGLKPGDIVYVAEQDFNDSRIHTLKKGTISSLGKSGLAFVVELSPAFHLQDGTQPTAIARKPRELFTAKQVMDIAFFSEPNQRPKIADEAYIDEHMSDPALVLKVAAESVIRLRTETSVTP